MKTIDWFEPRKLLELLNDPARTSEEQKQKERAGQNSSEKLPEPLKKDAQEMLENFEKKEQPKNKISYEPVNKDMVVSEIIKISLKNKDKL